MSDWELVLIRCAAESHPKKIAKVGVFSRHAPEGQWVVAGTFLLDDREIDRRAVVGSSRSGSKSPDLAREFNERGRTRVQLECTLCGLRAEALPETMRVLLSRLEQCSQLDPLPGVIVAPAEEYEDTGERAPQRVFIDLSVIVAILSSSRRP